MTNHVVPSRSIESEKDARGRITHWHCNVCGWTTLGIPSYSMSMRLQAICDAFTAHDCRSHKLGKAAKSNLKKAVA
jgi:hypothetical protein